MERKTLMSKEIVSIIKACGEHGVRVFKQGDLEIIFGKEESVEQDLAYVDPSLLRPIEVDPRFAEEQAAINREEELENLMISDPALYEEMLVEGHYNAETE